MSATEQGLNVRAVGRWDIRPVVSPEQELALADFHVRTDGSFSQVRDLSLIGAYARTKGWSQIADVLLPKRAS